MNFSAETIKELKHRIKCKYGSISYFCKLTNRSLQDANIALRMKSVASAKYVQLMLNDVESINFSILEGYHLTVEQRAKLRLALKRQKYGVKDFCEYHNKKYAKNGISTVITPVFISRTLTGRTQKITPRVRQLAELLNVPLPKFKNKSQYE